MSMFTLDQFLAKVKTQTYVVSGSGKKSTYDYNGSEVYGYLTPVSIRNSSAGINTFWQERQFETETPLDAEESDILEIDSVDYKIKSFARVKGITIDRMRYILIKSKGE